MEKNALLFTLSFLPFLSCLIYRAGFLASVNTLLVLFIVIAVQFKYIKKTLPFAICGILSVISVGLTEQINTQLYVSKVSDDWASLYLGNIFTISAVVISTVSVITFSIIKHIKIRNKNQE